MDYGVIATGWAALARTARMVVLAEADRWAIAEGIRRDCASHVAEAAVLDIARGDPWPILRALGPDDLLVVLLTMDGFMRLGYRERFSPFARPDGLACRYVFVRLDIPEASLLTGLNMPRHAVEATLAACAAYGPGRRVRVTAPGGTDITVRVRAQETLPWDASGPGGVAFLPPAEISEDLDPTSAEGVIVADITVGELRFYADLIDPLGLVDVPVRLVVRGGRVCGITGGRIAARLRDGLARLDPALQAVVELGHGLSDMAPTGIIGVDESIRGTCHFGIGSRDPYHVDVVVRDPCIDVL